MELSRQMLLLTAENYGSYYLHITKAKKNFLRVDNLKICKRSAFGGRKRGKIEGYDWRARDN